jgi:hypothetical protein
MLFRAKRNGKPYGSYLLDVVTKSVGRIRNSTGVYPRTRNADKVVSAITEMIYDLDESRDVERLALIKSGKVGVLDALNDWQLGRTSFIADHANESLEESLNNWIETSGQSTHTKRTRTNMVRRLKSLGLLTEESLVRDLPDILRRCRARYDGEGKSSAFNQFRSYSLTFLRHYCGYDDDIFIYKHCLKIRTLPIKKIREHHPLATFSEFLDLLEVVNPARGSNDDPKNPTDYRSWIAFMVFTGTRPTEFFGGRWERDKKTGHIHILGEKTANADRVVPSIVWLPPIARPEFGLPQRLEKLEVPQRVRDFRRTYSLWLESAGVPRNRISLYMGHGPRDMTTLYQKQRPTTDLLNEDRQRILDWIESQKASQNKKTKRVWADSTANFLAKLVAAS